MTARKTTTKTYKPTVTVIIPAFKAAPYLAECLATIARQSKIPNAVYIGADACQESLRSAFDYMPHEIRNITKVAYFPEHAGAYRIRNTMALMASTDIITTFDADDWMYPRHLAAMTDGLMPGQVRVALGDKQGEDRPHKAHGIQAWCRRDFINMGGYETWPCGADTEALQRAEQAGMEVTTLDVTTMKIRVHEGSLTQTRATGYDSEIRKTVRGEIRKRRSEPVTLDAIGISRFDWICQERE